jgi:hypothetical protein
MKAMAGKLPKISKGCYAFGHFPRWSEIQNAIETKTNRDICNRL